MAEGSIENGSKHDQLQLSFRFMRFIFDPSALSRASAPHSYNHYLESSSDQCSCTDLITSLGTEKQTSPMFPGMPGDSNEMLCAEWRFSLEKTNKLVYREENHLTTPCQSS